MSKGFVKSIRRGPGKNKCSRLWKCYLYFAIAHGTSPLRIKIGITNNPKGRLADLQRMCPVRLDMLAMIEGGLELERELHSHFDVFRTHGEWFKAEKDLIDVALYARRFGKIPDLSLYAVAS